jgi:tRNA A-37 threonylcarbamoyl transferase component Bud32
MRISLLLQREPFPQILEVTLGQYWSQKLRQTVKLKWDSSLSSKVFAKAGIQTWVVNCYLNSIFIPSANPGIFEPVRAEFSYSRIPWRRPLQKEYVHAALTWPTSLFLSQASLSVSPAIPEAQNVLIVAGNHKIRLLDAAQKQVTSVLKQNFENKFFECELEARSQAKQLGLPVPGLKEVARDRTWFCEEYVGGTPLNRLTDETQVQAGMQLALKALYGFIEEHLYSLPTEEYADTLLEKIKQLIDCNQLFNICQKNTLWAVVQTLHHEITRNLSMRKRQRVMLSKVHGDFQPANILFDAGQIWLIDWEYCDKRQSSYDLLTLICGSRHPEGLAKRLWNFEKYAEVSGMNFPTCWPGLEMDTIARRHVMVSLFFMEELLLHLRENANPLFHHLGRGLLQTGIESLRWVKIHAAT